MCLMFFLSSGPLTALGYSHLYPRLGRHLLKHPDHLENTNKHITKSVTYMDHSLKNDSTKSIQGKSKESLGHFLTFSDSQPQGFFHH